MSQLRRTLAENTVTFFDCFGEDATYKGKPIQVIPEIGASWNKGLPSSSPGSAATAKMSVKSEDIPDPAVGDLIVYEGKTWRVVRVIFTDENIHELECSGNESSLYRR
jgi:hypothetical protein